MRISVNLATRPYVELRPFFLRLRLVMGILAVLGVGAIIAAHVLQKKLDRAEAQMDRLHNKMVAAQQEKLHNEQRMRQPANAAVLDRAHFLNGLFLRKSFSWTAVMMDLERVLPTGVQVTSIEPEISADGDVVIRLRVAGDRDRAVQLVRNLERSQRFLEPRLMGESVEATQAGGQGNPAAAARIAPAGVEFEILANYNPLPAGESYARPAHVQKVAEGAAVRTQIRTRTRSNAGGNDGVVLPPYSQAHTGRPTRNGTPNSPNPPAPSPRAPKPPGGAR
jgi:type IV pilus assembly protein PilN